MTFDSHSSQSYRTTTPSTGIQLSVQRRTRATGADGEAMKAYARLLWKQQKRIRTSPRERIRFVT